MCNGRGLCQLLLQLRHLLLQLPALSARSGGSGCRLLLQPRRHEGARVSAGSSLPGPETEAIADTNTDDGTYATTGPKTQYQHNYIS